MTDTPETPAPLPAQPPGRRAGRRTGRRRGRRILLALLLVIILVPVAAALAAFLTFDPNAYKPRIAAAIAQATGRQVTLAGPLTVKLSWVPTLAAQDVRIGNIAGGTAPDMARIAEIDGRIALLPMLRHRLEIQNLVLRRPDVLLERLADNRANWLFQPQAAAGPLSPQPATASPGAGPWQVAIDSLQIIDGRFTYRDEVNGTSAVLAVPHAELAARVTGDASPMSAPIALAIDAVWQGLPVTLSGTTGPLAHLTDPADRSPWPLDLILTAQGAKMQATGTITDPRQARGYAVDLHGTVPALEALTPLLPAPPPSALPPIHGITIGAHLADTGQTIPTVTDLSLQAQASDLGALLPGLKLDSLSVITPALDQPATVNVLGQRNGLAFTLSGSLGPLAALLQPKTALPVDLVLTAGQSNLHMRGAIAEPLSLRGLDLSLAVQIADLGTLSPLAGTTLPAVTNVTAAATLGDMPQGPGQSASRGVLLTAIDITAPQGDLEGAAGLEDDGRPMVTADLRSARLDLDALSALTERSAPAPASPVPASPIPAPRPTAPPAGAQPAERMVIPDLPLPVSALRSLDGKVNLAFASLRLGGLDYRALVTQVSLLHGLLAVQPSSVVIPGGAMDFAGQIDARGAVPHLAFAMQAPSLAIAPLLGAAQMPPAANGLMQVFANLTGSGLTTRALSASLSGSIGVAAVNGVIDGRALAALIRPAIHAARIIPPQLLDAAGQLPLRCLALRLDATNGVGVVQALVLDASALLLQGSGSVAFGPESLALSLRPNLYLGDTELTVPLTVGGSFADPRLGKVGSVVINERPDAAHGINGLFQSLVGGKHRPPPVSAACAPALVLARNGQPGPAPEPGDTGLLGRPMDLLQQLLHGQ